MITSPEVRKGLRRRPPDERRLAVAQCPLPAGMFVNAAAGIVLPPRLFFAVGTVDSSATLSSSLDEGVTSPEVRKGITSPEVRRGLHLPRLERGLHLLRLEGGYISRGSKGGYISRGKKGCDYISRD